MHILGVYEKNLCSEKEKNKEDITQRENRIIMVCICSCYSTLCMPSNHQPPTVWWCEDATICVFKLQLVKKSINVVTCRGRLVQVVTYMSFEPTYKLQLVHTICTSCNCICLLQLIY